MRLLSGIEKTEFDALFVLKLALENDSTPSEKAVSNSDCATTTTKKEFLLRERRTLMSFHRTNLELHLLRIEGFLFDGDFPHTGNLSKVLNVCLSTL